MRYSWRTQKNTPIPALPSILTFFPASTDQVSRQASTTESVDGRIGEGLEIVPIERSNTSCAKTVSPDTDDKEVLSATLALRKDHAKPLPPLPRGAWLLLAKARWSRQPVKRRVFVLLGFGLLSVVCLSLLSLRAHRTKKNQIQDHNDTLITANSPSTTPVPDGSFRIGLGYPRQQSAACLSDNDESISWSCALGAVLDVKIYSQEATLEKQFLEVRFGHGVDESTYGEQSFSISEVTLDRINDTKTKGTDATHIFRTIYNRTVLLPGSQLSFVDSSQQSDRSELRDSLSHNDRPWLCYFNNTSLEGQIYTSQNASTVANSTVRVKRNFTEAVPSAFPYVIQITEQWSANETRAYCEQVASAKDRSRTSSTLRYFLNTTDTSIVSGVSLDSQRKKRVNGPKSVCQCQWVLQ